MQTTYTGRFPAKKFKDEEKTLENLTVFRGPVQNFPRFADFMYAVNFNSNYLSMVPNPNIVSTTAMYPVNHTLGIYVCKVQLLKRLIVRNVPRPLRRRIRSTFLRSDYLPLPLCNRSNLRRQLEQHAWVGN